ncbi:MAG: type II CRISPR-associated endonuclease Cas1 [Candidatus Mycalebacterium zealandia]|nr:MAG: type II CRISPR-associated endonuclease Cas1 [Candidatus Mycalebacterium zealandia]
MIKRIIEISNPAYLHLKDCQMIIRKESENDSSIPVEDMGILILANPAISISQSLIAECQKNNCIIVFCDQRHLPVSALLPLSGNSMHSKVLNIQTGVKKPLKKRLWQKIIIAKTEAQIQTLLFFKKDPGTLPSLKKRVQSGDPKNIEAQAAKIYWSILFGKEFGRDYKESGVNSLLNYGYSLIRASVARALCGTGLHPALGIHHHNQYNPMCLADDIMEPLRPLVDRRVYELNENGKTEIDKKIKLSLLSLLSEDVLLEEKKLPMMVANQYMAASLKKAFSEGIDSLKIPELIENKQMRIEM